MRFHKMKKDLSVSLRLLLVLGVFIAIPSLAFKSETAGRLNLSLDVAYAESSSSTLPSIMYQKGSPASSLNVSGKVLYYTATGNDTIPVGCSAITTPTLCSPNAAKPVPRVTMTATVGTPAVPSTMTALDGTYTLSGFGPDTGTNTYTVTPSKTAQQDINGITSLDAGLIGIFAAGGGTPFTTCRTIAGDSSGNGSITSLDAGQVGRFAAGLGTSVGNTGQWRFLANCVTYNGMVTDQTNQNYTAILIGDVNNSWTTPASGPQSVRPNAVTAVGVSIATLLVHQNAGVISVPISVSGLSGEISYDLNVAFNSAILTPANPPFDKVGTISANATVNFSTTTGNLRLGAFDPNGFSTTPGTLINLRFNVVGTNGQSTTVSFAPSSTPPPLASPGVFFDDVPPMTITNGSVTVGPTAVTFDDCKITAYDRGSVLEWQTGNEVENLGFNIYREEGGKRTRVNDNLIAGSALKAKSDLSTGEAYGWWDDGSNSNASYWIEDIDLNGKSNWHGPFYASYVGGKPPEFSRAALLSNLGNRSKEDITRVVEDRGPINDINTFNASRHYAFIEGSTNSFASEPSFKIGIKETGWYRITQPEIVAAGFNPNTNAADLQLFVDGREVPMAVSGKGGVFDDQSAIEFYATSLNSLLSDIHTYWLVAGNQVGLRIPEVQGNGAPTSSRNFTQTVERRDRSVYFSSLLNGDEENFFGAVVSNTPLDQTITLNHLDQGEATLEVALQGVSTIGHRVTVLVNGLSAGEVVFESQQHNATKLSLPGSFLREGSNTITLASQNGSRDVSLVDYLRVSYPHSYTADNDYLSFTAEGKESVTIGGFSSKNVRVFDVTDPYAVKELVYDLSGKRKKGFKVTVTPTDSGKRNLIATTQDQPRKSAIIVANQPSNWRSPDAAADLVIITSRVLFPAVEPLKVAREQEGYRVAMVDIEDIYDEFNFGNKSAQAIRDFLSYAKSNWRLAPKFVVLAGDASFDPKNYLGFGYNDLVPTKLVDTSEIETASDDWFTDFDNDGIADIAIGRLPVRNTAEASVVISKVTRSRISSSSSSALLVSDMPDIWNFEQENTTLRSLLSSTYLVKEIKRRELGDDQSRTQLRAALNAGPRIVNYYGHGSTNLLRGNLLNTTDAATLTNGDNLSVFTLMDCLNGYFQDVSGDSLAEALLKADKGGALAVWTSSGLTLPNEQARMNQQLYNLLFGGSQGNLTLGEAIQRAKAATTDSDIRRTWILLGDPTTRIK